MVDNFFNQIQVQYIVEVKQLIEQVKEVDNVAKFTLLYKQCPKEKLVETIEALLETCRVIHGKLLLLEMYAHVNYCGFTKITKKHDRVTGYATQKKYMQKKVNVVRFSSFTLYVSLVLVIDQFTQFGPNRGRSIHRSIQMSLPHGDGSSYQAER